MAPPIVHRVRRRGGGSTGRVQGIRRTKSAQVRVVERREAGEVGEEGGGRGGEEGSGRGGEERVERIYLLCSYNFNMCSFVYIREVLPPMLIRYLCAYVVQNTLLPHTYLTYACITHPHTSHMHTPHTCTYLTHAHTSHMHTPHTCTHLTHAHASHMHTPPTCTHLPHAHTSHMHTPPTCTHLPRAHHSLDEGTAGQRASLSTIQATKKVSIQSPAMFSSGCFRSGSFPLYSGELSKVVIEQRPTE